MIELVARRVLGYVAILVGASAGPGAIQEAKNVKVTVVCILAKECPPHVDPELIHIAKEIQKKRPDLKCFKIECQSCQSLPVDKKSIFKLCGQQKAVVLIKQAADKHNKVILEVKPPLGGEIEYETVCGKFLPIITRYETKNGERLILAIRVQPCNGGK